MENDPVVSTFGVSSDQTATALRLLSEGGVRVKCSTCDRVYDDAEFLTICPHDVGLDGRKYCRYHDLFDCQFADLPGATR